MGRAIAGTQTREPVRLSLTGGGVSLPRPHVVAVHRPAVEPKQIGLERRVDEVAEAEMPRN
jgi:hypothetical protein